MRRAAPAVALALAALAGCELREITLAEPERVIVAEAYVRVGGAAPLATPATEAAAVLLHETLGADGGSAPVPGARVLIRRPRDGHVVVLREAALGNCAITIPIQGSGTCYQPEIATGREPLLPGDRLVLHVELPGGGVLESETTVPGAFALLGLAEGEVCALAPGSQGAIAWTGSAGAWAYISDTFVQGLGPIFGSDLVDDPLYLFGLSVSARDTTITFPAEFGLFARAELDQAVSLALQRGLPPGTAAGVAVAAVDRNWVNWSRGGSFNPSGVVRVPSVRGDGTGVFASAVVRTFGVVSREPDPSSSACPEVASGGS